MFFFFLGIMEALAHVGDYELGNPSPGNVGFLLHVFAAAILAPISMITWRYTKLFDLYK